MTLATILLRLWKLRLWVAVGLLVAVCATAASLKLHRSAVYANASTQLLVDSPSSALANAQSDLTGYSARANVFASLMTSNEALSYIGKAAGIPGNLIDANGPVQVSGAPSASHAPVRIAGGVQTPAPTIYKLSLLQNPSLPTVDVYAQAPTTPQAIALANGAVTGTAALIKKLDEKVPPRKRIVIRSLGLATGGLVDPAASKKVALLIFVAVFAIWCVFVLFAERLIADLRAARRADHDDQPTARDADGILNDDGTESTIPDRELLESTRHQPSERVIDSAAQDPWADRPTGAWDEAGYRRRIADPVDGEISDDEGVRDHIGLRP